MMFCYSCKKFCQEFIIFKGMFILLHIFITAESSFVLTYYKTEPCKRPPRLCRQGYACPFYHNNKDRRRTPKKFKYRYLYGPAAIVKNAVRDDGTPLMVRGSPFSFVFCFFFNFAFGESMIVHVLLRRIE